MKIIAKFQVAQYNDTFFHRLDPRVKIAVALLFALIGPLMDSPSKLAGLTILAGGYMLLAGMVRTLLVVTAFFLLSMLTYLFSEALIFKRPPEYLEYLTLSFTMMPIMFGGLLLGMTTTLEKLVTGLGKLGMPVGMRYAVIVALRYVSMLGRELGHAIQGMKVRGVMPGLKDFFKKPFNTLRILSVPLVIRSFKVADRMGAAAELRGLSSPENTLSLAELHMTGIDLAFLSVNFLLVFFLWAI